ncbi:MAG TPA: J domain-containing protein [Desulfomonilaceae bacterium]|nr:J domain-containing protein [Desulfomonilaceae bacterium]
MAKRDPYNVLGVNKSASEDEIKAAYRRLARVHHPDMNNNSKSSEARFKEISEAYEILSDTEKRRNYDRFGHDNGERYGFRTSNPFASGFGQGQQFNVKFGGGGPGHGMFDDVFSQFFGSGGGRHRYAAKGDDLEYDLTISFEQAYHGISATVRVLERKISVHIPAGVDTGSVIRVPGQGTPGRRGGSPGDLFLNITVAPHKIFRREGNDIRLTLPISIAEAILGAKVETPGPNGRLVLKIPPGTQSGTSFRFRGKGFPSLKNGRNGDFYVEAQIVIPERVKPASKDLVEEFERLNPTNPREGL